MPDVLIGDIAEIILSKLPHNALRSVTRTNKRMRTLVLKLMRTRFAKLGKHSLRWNMCGAARHPLHAFLPVDNGTDVPLLVYNVGDCIVSRDDEISVVMEFDVTQTQLSATGTVNGGTLPSGETMLFQYNKTGCFAIQWNRGITSIKFQRSTLALKTCSMMLQSEDPLVSACTVWNSTLYVFLYNGILSIPKCSCGDFTWRGAVFDFRIINRAVAFCSSQPMAAFFAWHYKAPHELMCFDMCRQTWIPVYCTRLEGSADIVKHLEKLTLREENGVWTATVFTDRDYGVLAMCRFARDVDNGEFFGTWSIARYPPNLSLSAFIRTSGKNVDIFDNQVRYFLEIE